MRPPFASGWSAFVEKFICIDCVIVAIPFDLRRLICGLLQLLTEGGGISVVSIASLSDALALVERKLLAVLGCEMLKAERLNADKLERCSSSSMSSSDDSTGVSVRGIVQSPVD